MNRSLRRYRLRWQIRAKQGRASSQGCPVSIVHRDSSSLDGPGRPLSRRTRLRGAPIVHASPSDSDVDGIGNACDSTPFPDTHGDGIYDNVDNCFQVPNRDQANFDHDNYGDACDPDASNDGLLNSQDAVPLGMPWGDAALAAGFFAPVDNWPVLNKAKAGSTIPIRFTLGGNRGLDIFQLGAPRIMGIGCPNGATVDPVEETLPNASSVLTYSADAGSVYLRPHSP